MPGGIIMAKSHLTKTGLEIMEYIWSLDQDVVTAREIRDAFSYKHWSKQSISSFLKRLVNIGYLSMSKYPDGKHYYTPLVSKEEHKLYPATNIVNEFFNGSYAKFVCSFVPMDTMSQSELDELKEFISKYDRQDENT